MSGPREQFDRAVDQLEQDRDDGRISPAEFNAELREMERDYRADAEEDARSAYDDRMEQW